MTCEAYGVGVFVSLAFVLGIVMVIAAPTPIAIFGACFLIGLISCVILGVLDDGEYGNPM